MAFQAERQYRRFGRGKQERCWCGADLLPFRWHPSYGVCSACGTYVNRRPPLRSELQKFYSLDLYWRGRQALKGFPTIDTRAEHYRSDGRLAGWLKLVARFGPPRGRVIEVGCAPGVLLEELSARGYECVGVEASDDVAEWLRLKTALDIRSGLFPGVPLPECDLFLSFDVLEHAPSPREFVREAARCLVPGGTAIIQTAIDRYDFVPPFGPRFDIFDDLEHTFLYTDKAITMLADQAGLAVVSLDEGAWIAGETVILRKQVTEGSPRPNGNALGTRR